MDLLPLRGLPVALQALQDSLANQCMGIRRLEIRPLPALLPAGALNLEPAVLSSSPVDHSHAASGRDAVSMRAVPMQLCKLSAVQGTVLLEEEQPSASAA
jgi:hypothetical protein